MVGNWNEESFEEYKLALTKKNSCLSVWELIELVGMGHFSKGMTSQTRVMGISEVFQELILDVLKQVSLGIDEPLSLFVSAREAMTMTMFHRLYRAERCLPS